MVYVHPEAQTFVDSQESGAPIETLAPELVREAQHAGLSKRGEPSEMASDQDTEIAGVPVRVYEHFNEEHQLPKLRALPCIRSLFIPRWRLGDW